MLNAKSVNINKKQVNVKLICQEAALSKAAPDSQRLIFYFSLWLSLAIALLSAQTPLKSRNKNLFARASKHCELCDNLCFVCLFVFFVLPSSNFNFKTDREKKCNETKICGRDFSLSASNLDNSNRLIFIKKKFAFKFKAGLLDFNWKTGRSTKRFLKPAK